MSFITKQIAVIPGTKLSVAPYQIQLYGGRVTKWLMETHCPSLTNNRVRYSPFTDGEQHTAFAIRNTKRQNPIAQYTRQYRVMSDHGMVSLDWLNPNNAPNAPIVVMVPGIGGSSREYHIRRLAQTLSNHYRVVVMNHRGLGNTPLFSPRLFGFSDSRDFADTLSYLRKQYPKAPLLAVGFSMGANMLTRYLGQQGVKSLLSAAVVISCPFNVYGIANAVNRPTAFNKEVFNPVLAGAIRNMVSKNLDQIQASPFNYGGIQEMLKHLQCFISCHSHLLSKPYGYQDCWEYFDYASSTPYVEGIMTPYVSINAMDDPTVPPDYIPLNTMLGNPYTLQILTNYGGHLGFLDTQEGLWHEQPVDEFFGAICRQLPGKDWHTC